MTGVQNAIENKVPLKGWKGYQACKRLQVIQAIFMWPSSLPHLLAMAP